MFFLYFFLFHPIRHRFLFTCEFFRVSHYRNIHQLYRFTYIEKRFYVDIKYWSCKQHDIFQSHPFRPIYQFKQWAMGEGEKMFLNIINDLERYSTEEEEKWIIHTLEQQQQASKQGNIWNVWAFFNIHAIMNMWNIFYGNILTHIKKYSHMVQKQNQLMKFMKYLLRDVALGEREKNFLCALYFILICNVNFSWLSLFQLFINAAACCSAS